MTLGLKGRRNRENVTGALHPVVEAGRARL
jgi:hypothetical protein